MKKALIVLLVLVVLLAGLPFLMGMGMASCLDCGPATLAAAGCVLAILAAGVTVIFALLARRLRTGRDVMVTAFHSFLLERPPQPA